MGHLVGIRTLVLKLGSVCTISDRSECSKRLCLLMCTMFTDGDLISLSSCAIPFDLVKVLALR